MIINAGHLAQPATGTLVIVQQTHAARAIAEGHPDARATFLGGSVFTVRRTATSDLDMVILLHGPRLCTG